MTGHPLHVSELLATIDGAAFIQRVSIDSYRNLTTAKKAIEKAFTCQIEGRGFSFVEILSPCPTDWGMTPKEAAEWVDKSLSAEYPLGIIRDRTGKTD
jgi:2-oxoglutarate ferredoxin oxidoreductase subunit beta